MLSTIGLLTIGAAYFMWSYEPQFSQLAAAIGAVLLVLGLIPTRKTKYTACCSASIYQDLEREGFTSPYLTCPIKGDANYEYLMKNPKEYKALIIDANYSETNVFTINDITEAIKLHMSKVPVIVRLDQSTYGSTDISWMLLALSSNQLTVLNTAQLTSLLMKYYGR